MHERASGLHLSSGRAVVVLAAGCWSKTDRMEDIVLARRYATVT